ncbi:MAG: response regulator transcription factor [Candidatus Scalinduaceae bacterium]
MENKNQNVCEAEIIKEADANIVNGDYDTALVKVLRGEMASLKATNDSLRIKLQYLREKFLPNILLVEDDIDARSIITEYLNDNYNVLEVGNGIEALSMLRKMAKTGSGIKRIDSILLDITLPGICGYTLCREVKKNMKLNIPVIFCTAKNTKKDVIKAIESGADDYLIKPFQEITLLEKIYKWTKKKQEVLPTRSI